MDILAILQFLQPFLIATAVFGLGYLYQYILIRTPKSVHDALSNAASVAVAGAAQKHDGAANEVKKAYAVQAVEAACTYFHLKVDPSMIDSAIEAAVGAFKAAQPAPIVQVAPVVPVTAPQAVPAS